MMKSASVRSNELDEVVKKFVFAVPKAGANKIQFNANYVDYEGSQAEMQAKGVLVNAGYEKVSRGRRLARSEATRMWSERTATSTMKATCMWSSSDEDLPRSRFLYVPLSLLVLRTFLIY